MLIHTCDDGIVPCNFFVKLASGLGSSVSRMGDFITRASVLPYEKYYRLHQIRFFFKSDRGRIFIFKSGIRAGPGFR